MKCPHCGEPFDQLDIQFDYYSGLVKCGNSTVRLSPQQLTVLECLIDAYPAGAHKWDVYDVIYSDRDAESLPYENALRMAISNLKRALETAKFPFRIGRLYLDGPNTNIILVSAEENTRAA